jgi:hypothetical protein
MITPGAILIEMGTVLPEPLRLETAPTESGWTVMANNLDRLQISKELATAGWIFFYLAGVIKTTAFGFDRGKSIKTAMKRLFATVKLQKCNCVEIDEVATLSFWGVPYVRVTAHSRRIQKSSAPRKWPSWEKAV